MNTKMTGFKGFIKIYHFKGKKVFFLIERLPGTLSFELDLHKCGIVKMVK